MAWVMLVWLGGTWISIQGHAWLFAACLGLGYPAVYLISLPIAPVVRHGCEKGTVRHRLPWPLRLLFPGAYRRAGCRRRWCVDGDLVRLGVRLLMRQRALAMIERR